MSVHAIQPARAAAAHVTKQQAVYRMLRESILRCELRPGARLVIDELARQFQMSIIPVREALRQLQAEGLVLSVAHVGGTVAPISHDSVVEVFTVLEGLEVVATRAAAGRLDAAHIATLAGLVASMDDAIAADSPGIWAEINTRFHLAIAEIAAMPMLLDMLQRAFDRWERVRRYYFSDVLIHRTRIAQAEHHELLRQMQARDLIGLERTIREHNQAALASYLTYLASDSVPCTRESLR
jgi:DNA-binding GntR family transcriptional regulator